MPDLRKPAVPPTSAGKQCELTAQALVNDLASDDDKR